MIKEAIVKIVNKGDLTYSEAYAVMNEIMKTICRVLLNTWLRNSFMKK